MAEEQTCKWGLNLKFVRQNLQWHAISLNQPAGQWRFFCGKCPNFNQTLFACLVGSRHGRGETVVRMWRRRQAGLQQRMWRGGCTSLVGTRASGDGWCPLISESQSPCVHVSRAFRSASVTAAMCPCVTGAQKRFWSHLSHRHHQNLPAFVDIFIFSFHLSSSLPLLQIPCPIRQKRHCVCLHAILTGQVPARPPSALYWLGLAGPAVVLVYSVDHLETSLRSSAAVTAKMSVYSGRPHRHQCRSCRKK